MTRYPWMKIESIKFKFSMTKQDKDLKAKRGAWEILFYECVSLYGHYWFFISLLILFINTCNNFDWNYCDRFCIKCAKTSFSIFKFIYLSNEFCQTKIFYECHVSTNFSFDVNTKLEKHGHSIIHKGLIWDVIGRFLAYTRQ